MVGGMKMRNVACQIAHTLMAYRTCRDRSQGPLGGDAERWANRHNAALSDLLRDEMPSGAGIESAELITEESTEEQLVFEVTYHAMNDAGYYDGYLTYRVTVKPYWVGVQMSAVKTADSAGGDIDRDSIDESILDRLGEALEKPMDQMPRHYYAEQ